MGAIRMKTRLSALPIDGQACVSTLDPACPMRRRLLDLGFTQGAQARCLYQSPWGDPRAYWVRGAVVALRNADAAQIWLGEGEGS